MWCPHEDYTGRPDVNLAKRGMSSMALIRGRLDLGFLHNETPEVVADENERSRLSTSMLALLQNGLLINHAVSKPCDIT